MEEAQLATTSLRPHINAIKLGYEEGHLASLVALLLEQCTRWKLPAAVPFYAVRYLYSYLKAAPPLSSHQRLELYGLCALRVAMKHHLPPREASAPQPQPQLAAVPEPLQAGAPGMVEDTTASLAAHMEADTDERRRERNAPTAWHFAERLLAAMTEEEEQAAAVCPPL
ncbi:hypothetical protein GPECTOR_461g369 [Gonium pectorale]|uniref:Uncharacterized protein n=1 Tax=Gonium pectorale TaxID=33097 RepID=A0A150FV11_GONPE|nr:hypothetical protein GPECTOR_461g369 [Gonium pectorale]|eukprot:KXZ41452.1 hypothetical protein GPECTOR_461g369 [Gonium pectorale]